MGHLATVKNSAPDVQTFPIIRRLTLGQLTKEALFVQNHSDAMNAVRFQQVNL